MLGTAAFVVALENSLLTSGPGQEGEKRDAGAGLLVIFLLLFSPGPQPIVLVSI